MDKAELRSYYLRCRLALDADQRQRWDALVQRRCLELDALASAATIALYSPVRGEVDTSALLRWALAQGKTIVYPRVRDDGLDFHVVKTVDELRIGAFGVLEPSGTATVAVDGIDLFIVPAVAFDCDGYRLGYGKGFYDRALPARAADSVLVGVNYSTQITAVLPREQHDIPVDILVSEQRVYEINIQ